MAKSSKAAVNAEFDAAIDTSISDFEKLLAEQFSTWEKVDIGFAPYWVPEVNKFIVGRVSALDFSDPSFHRVVFQATRIPIQCQRGPADEAEQVVVKPGEFFTMSEYAAMDLANFMDIEVVIRCSGTRSVPADKTRDLPKRDMFEWEVIVSPEDKQKLQALRAGEMKLLAARRTIGEGELVSPSAQLTA